MWLIAGGTGQLGIALGRVLEAQSIPYVSMGSAELDIRNSNQTSQILHSLKPSIVVNAAAWTDVDGAEKNEIDAYAVNATGAANLADASREIGAKFVHISTDYVFSGEASEPWKEEDSHSPISAYGRTKAAGETFVLDIYPENSYIVRTAWLYSPWGKNFVKTMKKLALSNNQEVRVVNDQIGQPTSAISLAEQIVKLIRSDAPVGIYHGTNAGQTNWFEFAQEIFLALKVDVSRVKPVATSEYKQVAKRPSFSVLSHNRWSNTSITPMPEWNVALTKILSDLEVDSSGSL